MYTSPSSGLRPLASGVRPLLSVLRSLPSVLWLLSLAWLWFTTINHLRVEWTLNPQYSYGWAVPFLCVYLIWNRMSDAGSQTAGGKSWDLRPPPSAFCPPPSALWIVLLALLAFAYLPTRLIQESHPGWRLVSWSLALITVGITLIAAKSAQAHQTTGLPDQESAGPATPSPLSPSVPWSRRLVFPLLFFLVSVPWPTLIEGPLVQGLTRANSGVTVEILDLLGIPAIQHGNVIEVSTGSVGIDEACSGIRSFQATLMISLFFGEFYRLSVLRRLTLCFAGFALSFAFNVVRTTLLTWVASSRGIEAIAGWHDPAGVTILLACFITLWLLGVGMGKATKGPRDQGTKALGAEIQKAETADDGRLATDIRRTETPPSAFLPPASALRPLLSVLRPPPSALWLILPAWLLASEIAVEAWYRAHERDLRPPVTWTVNWPEDNPTFRDVPWSRNTDWVLRQDEGRRAFWTYPDNTEWQAIFLRWNVGKVAYFMPRAHTPEICLSAAGFSVDTNPELKVFEINGLSMPFRHYAVEYSGLTAHVYFCIWEDRMPTQRFPHEHTSYALFLRSVLEGKRNTGLRSLEVLIAGIPDPAEAEAALKRELQKLIKVDHKTADN